MRARLSILPSLRYENVKGPKEHNVDPTFPALIPAPDNHSFDSTLSDLSSFTDFSCDRTLITRAILIGSNAGNGSKNLRKPIGVRMACLLGNALHLPVGRRQKELCPRNALRANEEAHSLSDPLRKNMAEVSPVDSKSLGHLLHIEIVIGEMILDVGRSATDQCMTIECSNLVRQSVG